MGRDGFYAVEPPAGCDRGDACRCRTDERFATMDAVLAPARWGSRLADAYRECILDRLEQRADGIAACLLEVWTQGGREAC